MFVGGEPSDLRGTRNRGKPKGNTRGVREAIERASQICLNRDFVQQRSLSTAQEEGITNRYENRERGICLRESRIRR